MTETPTPIPFDSEIRICPACGYTDGFHTMLRKGAACLAWLLICPSCHRVFDPGITLELPGMKRSGSPDRPGNAQADL